jgi:GntR family transcriptional repressor for pyruvate dehydrogenase complex
LGIDNPLDNPFELWQPIRQTTPAERVAEQILGYVAMERLSPSDPLPAERELADLLGESRSSVRDALRLLAARGRVTARHGGVFREDVSGMRPPRGVGSRNYSVHELHDMREVIELRAAEWCALHHDVARVAAVQRSYHDLQAAARAAEVDFDRLVTLDTTFHVRIAEATGNRFLADTVSALYEMLETDTRATFATPGRLERLHREHERIFLAITAGNGRAARRAAQAHVDATRVASRAASF